MPPTNKAAWLVAANKPFQIKKAPYTPPAKNEIVIKTRAIAFNPIDAMVHAMGSMLTSWISLPFIIGCDVAGEVVEVGSNVTRFRVGDRVLGTAAGIDQRSCRSCEGAFQEYVVLRTNVTAPIPGSMSFEQACVLPLGLNTAACGLFLKSFLGLEYPSVEGTTRRNETLVVWGGSTSVGSNAIQLAVNAGYDVIATASPKNFDYLKKLGATQVFDRSSRSAVRDITAALKGKHCAGALAIGDGSMTPCIDIVGASKGNKFVAQGSGPQPKSLASTSLATFSFFTSFMWSSASLSAKCSMKGVGSKLVWAGDVIAGDLGKAMYEDFLPEALSQGKYLPSPEPYVVGSGLESIQKGVDLVWKGVSAKKVVVVL